MRKHIYGLLLVLLSLPVQAQELLTYEQYIEWVRSFHPVAKQAEVTLRFGEQEVRASRGGFDPKIYGDFDRKEFKEKEYFNKQEAGIKVPTWAGVELKGLFEQNRGDFLNPERNVPNAGLVAMGASVNLGQGLLIDNRRAALRKAQIYRESTKAEREQILNDLYVDATEAYWSWASEFKNVKILEDGVKLADQRFQFVKDSYEFGDLPAIDTVEAYTQVMDRIYRFQNAQIKYFKATQVLNTFLWDENEDPVDLRDEINPENVLDVTVFDYSNESLREYVVRHPELRITDFDIESLEVERRLKANQLLPLLQVNYNFLTENLGETPFSPFLQNNYKMGMTFSMPLFLRKERGALGLAKAKLDMKNYQRDLKFVQLKNKLEAEIYNFETIDRQLMIFTNNVNGLQQLLTGELVRFEIGESSLFLVNAREVSLLNAQVTLNDLAGKRKSAYAKMLNAAGLGFED